MSNILVDIQSSIRRGALDVPSDDLETLLGRPVTPLTQAVQRIVDNLRTGAGE